jgi:hypothetical protein
LFGKAAFIDRESFISKLEDRFSNYLRPEQLRDLAMKKWYESIEAENEKNE